MRRAAIPAIVTVLLLLAGLSVGPARLDAKQDSSPAASPTGSAPPGAATPTPMCGPDEIAAGLDADVLPRGKEEGVVKPALEATDVEVLYVAVLTLPPDACIPFRYRLGAMVLFVQQGTVVYTAQEYAGAEVPVIMRGDSDGSAGDNIPVALGESVSLHAGDWVTQDRAVWYSFRNSGSEDAIISAAVFAAPPWDDERCQSGCRGRP
jgi:hypothetical protein